MTVYFLSQKTAALKLDGMYVGIIDLFERKVEIDGGSNVLAEIIPDDNALPVNFFLNEHFLHHPPDFAEVYLMEGDALIHIKNFTEKEAKIKVIAQTRFCGNLVTLFYGGGLQLTCEGSGFALYDMEPAFLNARFEEATVGGFPVLFLYGDGCVFALSAEGKRLLCTAAESCGYGETLRVTVKYETCAQVVCDCEFSYDGTTMQPMGSVARETAPVPPECLHFAFFESILTRADSAKYLCDDLKPKAAELQGFLGEFCAVTLPTQKFYARHGDLKAAGLVYRRGEHLYDVRYFAVESDSAGIANLYPVE